MLLSRIFSFALFNVDPDPSGGGGSGLMGGAPAPVSEPPQATPQPQAGNQDAPASILGDDGNFTSQWYQGNEDLTPFGKALDKFQSPAALAKSYALLERNRAVPGAESDPDAVTAFRNVNGIPQDASGYDIQIPEKLPEGVTLDQDGIDAYKQVFHELNLAPHQAQSLMEKHIEMTGQNIADSQGQAYAAQQEASDNLQKEWGNAYGANLEKAQKAFDGICAKAGVDPEQVSFTGDPAFAKIMAAVANTTSESAIVGGGGAQPVVGGGGKAEAHEIMTNPNHPDYNAFYDSQDPRNQEVFDKVARLNK